MTIIAAPAPPGEDLLRGRTSVSVAEFAAVCARLAALELAIERLQHPPLRPRDRARLGRLLPVLGAIFGDAIFTTADVFASGDVGLGLVIDGLGRKRVGRLLARGAGQAIAGVVVQQVGKEHGAALWLIVAVLA